MKSPKRSIESDKQRRTEGKKGEGGEVGREEGVSIEFRTCWKTPGYTGDARGNSTPARERKEPVSIIDHKHLDAQPDTKGDNIP